MGLKLRPYQDDAADFLYERDRAMILAPVGAGKTAITLTAMQAMLKDGYAERFLVLAPKRVCTDVWPVEVKKWAPDLTMAVAIGNAAQTLHPAIAVGDAGVHLGPGATHWPGQPDRGLGLRSPCALGG